MINPVTFLLTLACIKGPCLEKNSCHDQYGKMQTAELAGCISENCKNALQPCILQTVQDIITEMQKEDPSASAEALQHQAVAAVLKDLDSCLHCLGKIKEDIIEATMCFLQAFLDGTQQQNNNEKPPFMSSDQGYILCWIKTTINGLMSCFDHYDLGTLKTLYNTLLNHNARNEEISDCFLKLFPYWGKKCIPASMRLFGNSTVSRNTDSWQGFADCAPVWNDLISQCKHMSWDLHGSSPTIPVQVKDVFICSFNEMILATAMC